MPAVIQEPNLNSVECRDCGGAASLPSQDSAHMLDALHDFLTGHRACTSNVVVSVHRPGGEAHGLLVPVPRSGQGS